MLTGIALKVAATLVFALMSAVVKFQSAEFGVAEIVFFRSFFALIVTVLWLIWRGQFPQQLQTARPFGHILRSTTGGTSMALSFAALAVLPLPDVTALGYTTPLLIVVIAAFLLREPVNASRWIAVVVGFGGVIVMLWEHLQELRALSWNSGISGPTWGVVMVLTSALFLSVALIQTRRLALSEHTAAIVFYFQSTTLVCSAFVMVLAAVWPATLPGAQLLSTQAWVTPEWGPFWSLVAIGALGGAGQILMTLSYRYADASIIAIFDYTSLLWTSLLGLMFFSDIPSPQLILGAIIVAGSGTFVIWSERRKRKSRA